MERHVTLGDVTNTPRHGSRGGVKRTILELEQGNVAGGNHGIHTTTEQLNKATHKRQKARDTYANLTPEQKAARTAKPKENYDRRKAKTRGTNTTQEIAGASLDSGAFYGKSNVVNSGPYHGRQFEVAQCTIIDMNPTPRAETEPDDVDKSRLHRNDKYTREERTMHGSFNAESLVDKSPLSRAVGVEDLSPEEHKRGIERTRYAKMSDSEKQENVFKIMESPKKRDVSNQVVALNSPPIGTMESTLTQLNSGPRTMVSVKGRTFVPTSDAQTQVGKNNNAHGDRPLEILIESPSEDICIDMLIDRTFPNLDVNCTSATYMHERAILSTRNEHVDAVNALMIERFPGNKQVHYSFDSVEDDLWNNYPLDFLNSITPNGLSPHELTIKKNCPIILLRNLDPHHGLCNGTRLIVRGFQKNSIDAEIVNGQHAGERVFIPRIPMAPLEDLSLPFKFKRKQFPIRLSFAMTINKEQGQTIIPNVGIYFPEPIFFHGQLYVELSRGVSRETTWVLAR